MSESNEPKSSGSNVLFPKLDADDEHQDVTVIESLCLRCHEQGTTRLLLTKIPFFKEVIISSFKCDECGHSDTGIQSAGRIQEKGIRITLTVKDTKDLNRSVVKADSAIFAIPSLEFEQPPVNHKGEISTVEGLITGVVNGLEMLQPQRMEADPETAKKIEDFIVKLNDLKLVQTPFEIVIDDPTGNSFVENFKAPNADEQLQIEHYKRTKEMDMELGLQVDDNEEEEEKEEAKTDDNLKDEVLVFKTNCSNCNSPCDTNMKLVDIPFFKQVVIMATVCDACGVKDNEVKGATGIEPKGTKITLKITDPTDMSRDVLKSDTCGVSIPELELELMEGTLGGKFTTLEGLLDSIIFQLSESTPVSIGMVGDSSDTSRKDKMNVFLEKLRKVSKGEMLGVHVILDDPAGNSYLQNVYAPDADPEMVIEHYIRNYEQNETLGLNDMVTENYIKDEDNKENL